MTDILPWDHHILLIWNERETLSLLQGHLWYADEKYYTLIWYFLGSFHWSDSPELYLILPLIKKFSVFH